MRDVLSVALQRDTREAVLAGMVVTEVNVTSDLSLARVYYHVYDGVSRPEVEAALERAKGYLRSRIGQQVRMRQTPELRFMFDDALERGRRIEGILQSLPELQESDEPDASEGEKV